MENLRSAITSSRGFLLILLVVALLVGLPIAVWLDLRNLTESALLRQARDLNSAVTSMRAYYGNNVVGRILDSPGSTQVTHNYETIRGAIPIPATLSIELGRVIQRATAGHQVPVRVGFSVQESRAAQARCIRDACARDIAQRSEPAIDRGIVIDLQRSHSPDRAGSHGRGLHQLPQRPSGKPKT